MKSKFKIWVWDKFFSREIRETIPQHLTDAGSSSAKTGLVAGILKRIGLRNGDTTSKDFEDPEYDLKVIQTAYDTDSYVRQGADKYVDQVFKEGYSFFGKDENAVEYVKTRLAYIAEVTNTPTEQLFIDMAEDVVKYSNCTVAKARANDQATLPPGVTVNGLDGELPVAGYYCVNVTTMKCKRDKNGTITGWQQEVDGADKPVKFKAQDIIHMYFKREKGNAFGTPFLHPVLDDVRALRQAEENALKMMYRHIYPFYHVAVGDDDTPGSPTEIAEIQESINDMDVEGGLVTTNRVKIMPIASDKVIDASPYLKYMEERIFSGMGIPGIMFGRGNTANRSTGDNMTAEMGDRVKAIQKTIEMFVNSGMIKELLLEGGFDPILNPEHVVEFKFKDNDLDIKMKNETHAVFLYEHNAITEDEMRKDIGRDVITDRSKMHQMLITKVNSEMKATESSTGSSTTKSTSKETDNKQKPKNQHGEKTSPKKTTNSLNPENEFYIGMMKDIVDSTKTEIVSNGEKAEILLDYVVFSANMLQKELHIEVSDRYIVRLEGAINNFIEALKECELKDTQVEEHFNSILEAALNFREEE